MKAVKKDGAMMNSCTKKLLNELDILQTVNHVSQVFIGPSVLPQLVNFKSSTTIYLIAPLSSPMLSS